ncbi:MAG: prepilin-type N-terminal cleavage/methylation domain-containing protein [Candidatus Omnitrophica bacterium]|nr:prepilin-type N-terminal cleavage/methylation domain-containing protein [Candidatus Omnitrophota bacterium]
MRNFKEKGQINKAMRKSFSKRAGFTLLEVMIAAAIIMIVASGLIMAFVSCAFLNESSNNLVAAANDAQCVLEEIKTLSYGDIDVYSPPVFDNLIDENVTVQAAGTETSLTEVIANVSWSERQKTRYFELSTCIHR